MFSHRITLFKWLGFPVPLDASWLIIAVLITWSLAVGLFPTQYAGLSGPDYWWMAAAFPLDGGRILRAALWRWNGSFTRATRTASAIGSWFAMALIVLAVWQLLIGNFIQAIWWFLIGLFLNEPRSLRINGS